MKLILITFVVALAIAIAYAEPSGWGGYFQYANVPGWGQYEFGYNRGNHDHFTSRFEQGWGWKFKTKVRWGDKKGGYGEMYYDYQHAPKKGWGHGHSHGHGGKHHGSFSENIPTIVKPPTQPQALASNPQMIGVLPPSSHHHNRGAVHIVPPPRHMSTSSRRMGSMPDERMGRFMPLTQPIFMPIPPQISF